MGVSNVGQNDFIQQMLFLESGPLRRLQARRGDLDVRTGVISDLRTRVNKMKSLFAEFAQLGATSALRKFTVSSTDDKIVTATADSTANIAGHTVRVSQLAQAHSVATTAFVGTDEDIKDKSYTFEITVGATTTSIDVDVLQGDDNATVLQKVSNAIGSAGIGVNASVLTVDTNTGAQQLVLTSQETGTGTLIAEIADTTGKLMQDLGLEGTSSVGNFSANTTVEGQDAQFTIDGVSIVSASNEVDGVLPGIVFQLKSDDSPLSDVHIDVEHDKEAIKEKLQALMDAYNEVNEYLNTKLASGDETGAGRGELAGDLTFITFRNEIRSLLVRAVDPAYVQDGINTIDDVGLSLSRDGKLSLSDEEAFFNALTSSPDGVEAFFGSEGGIASRIEDITKAFTKVGGGLDLQDDLLDSRRDVLDLRIERMESFLEVREQQLRDQLGRLSQFVAQIGAQQSALNGLLTSQASFFGF